VFLQAEKHLAARTQERGPTMFVLGTHFWTVLVLVIGCAAVIAALAAAALGGPPRHHHGHHRRGH
jgi:hypothetical protein